jgi:hypothetical protein
MITLERRFNPPTRLIRTPLPPRRRVSYPKAMTLCIAAHCQHEGSPHIVLCCDWLSSDDYGSAETCDKLTWLKPGWFALLAGTVHKADEILAFFEEELKDLAITKTSALVEIRRLAREYMEHLRDHNSRLRYGFTVPELIKKRAFPKEDIDSISSMLTTSAEVIIATIIDGDPFIFEINTSGEVILQPEYSTIGTIAQASAFMQWRCVTSQDSLPSMLFEVYESKRFAEMDKDVGAHTSLYVLYPDGNLYQVKASYLAQMDKTRRGFDSNRTKTTLPKSLGDWRFSKPEKFE